MGKKKSESTLAAPSSAPFNNPFAALAVQKDALPSKPLPEPVVREAKGPARAVVRMEKKGRGVKEVTVVEQLGLSATELDKWLKALKQSLGCGGAIEEDTLVLQGDQRERLPDLLTARGVRKVTLG